MGFEHYNSVSTMEETKVLTNLVKTSLGDKIFIYQRKNFLNSNIFLDFISEFVHIFLLSTPPPPLVTRGFLKTSPCMKLNRKPPVTLDLEKQNISIYLSIH